MVMSSPQPGSTNANMGWTWTLPLILFLSLSSTGRALSSHRPCFVSRVSSTSRNSRGPRSTPNNLQRTFLSRDGGDQQQEGQASLTSIGKAEMAAILSHVENGTGDENYVVIDVRGADEIMMGTGTMSDAVHILPLPQITSMAAFDISEASFEAQFGFPKPDAEDALVFTCKAGPRSRQAAQLAAAAGYTTVLDYAGGADDWFGGELFYT